MSAVKKVRPHGTRAKYVYEKCRCFECRVANTNYQCGRDAAVRLPWRCHHSAGGTYCVRSLVTGEIALKGVSRAEAFAHRDRLNAPCKKKPGYQLVRTLRVRNHLKRLAAAGIGSRQVSKACGVTRNVLLRIQEGEIQKTRRETEARILGVDVADLADGALVDAGPTWSLLEEMLRAGHTKTAIAGLLGSNAKVPALQIRRDYCTSGTAKAVEALHRRLILGEKPRPQKPVAPPPAPLVALQAARLPYDPVADGRAYVRAQFNAGKPIDRLHLAELTGLTPEDNTRLVEQEASQWPKSIR